MGVFVIGMLPLIPNVLRRRMRLDSVRVGGSVDPAQLCCRNVFLCDGEEALKLILGICAELGCADGAALVFRRSFIRLDEDISGILVALYKIALCPADKLPYAVKILYGVQRLYRRCAKLVIYLSSEKY